MRQIQRYKNTNKYYKLLGFQLLSAFELRYIRDKTGNFHIITKAKSSFIVKETDAMTETLKRLCAMLGNNVGKSERQSEGNASG
jgi:hypothetical protein